MRPGFVLTASAALATLIAVPVVASATPAAPTTVRLVNGVLPGLDKLQTRGIPSAATKLQVTVSLTQRNAAGETIALKRMYTKHSGSYRRFMTPATFAEKYGVAGSTVSRVEKSLTADGMRVAYASPAGDLLTLSGDLAQAGKTFHVSFENYLAPNGYKFWANSSAPTVPLGVDVVTGLNDIPAFHLDSLGQQTLCSPVGTGPCIGAVTPQDLWSTYDMPSSDTGQGQKIAVIGAGDYVQVEKDLRTFEGEFGLPKVNVIEHNVADDLSYTDGEGEWAMDSEASTGMAPGVQELDYYFANDLGDADAFSAWVNDPNGPLQANFSVGGCEALDAVLGTISQDDPILEQGAMEGRSLFASTGDTGGSCTAVTGNGFLNTGAPQAEYPATSPYVVGVGGTTLYTTGDTPNSRAVENGWTYSGGGTSTFEAQPFWQSGVGTATMPGQCVADPSLDPVTSVTPCKGVPDVAAMSGDITVLTEAVGRQYAGNGYQDVEGGVDGADGGTSLASPLWVGMWARMQAAAPGRDGYYQGLGFAAPALYNLAYNPTEDDNDFYNVAVGTNGQWHDNPRSLLDPTGWSYVSGLGVPNVAPMTKDLTGSTSPANTSLPAPTGSTTTSTPPPGGSSSTCQSNGVVTNSTPAGVIDGEGPDDEAIDMQQVALTFDEATQTLQWQATVLDASQDDGLGRAFAFQFNVGADTYQVLASTDSSGQDFALDEVINEGTEVALPLDTVTGSFDDAANTVTIDLPLSEFNADASPDSLKVGSVLTGLNYESFAEDGDEPLVYQDSLGYYQEFSDPCGYTIG